MAGVIAGYVLSIRLYERTAKLFPDLSPDSAKIAGFLAIFIACILAALVIGWLAGKILKEAGIGWLNRVAGGILGFLKGFFIVAVVVMLLVTFLSQDNNLIKSSVTVPYVVSGVKLLGSFVPEDLWERYKKKIDALQAETVKKVMEKGKKNNKGEK